jgi:hypothetical protein
LTEMVCSGYSATRFHLISECMTFSVDVDDTMEHPLERYNAEAIDAATVALAGWHGGVGGCCTG